MSMAGVWERKLREQMERDEQSKDEPFDWEAHRVCCVPTVADSSGYRSLRARVLRRNADYFMQTRDETNLWAVPECSHRSWISATGDTCVEAPCNDDLVWTFTLIGDDIERGESRPIDELDYLIWAP